MAVIINPSAAHGRVGKRVTEIRTAFERRFPGRVTAHVTREPRHATELAALLSDRDIVVAVGGDGTVSEVARGLVEARGKAALGIAPLGTGNDLAHTLGYPRRFPDCVDAMTDGSRTAMDHGMVQIDDEGDRPFFNNVGIGFDALASRYATGYKHLPGPLAYGAGVIRALGVWSGPHARIQVDGAVVEMPLMFATVANGRRSGGLFVLTPGASLFDGVLDVCSIRFVTPLRALAVAPRTLNGSHTNIEEISMDSGRDIRIEVSEPAPVHVDGEVLTSSCRRLRCRVVTGGLAVVVPVGGRKARRRRRAM